MKGLSWGKTTKEKIMRFPLETDTFYINNMGKLFICKATQEITLRK